MMDTFECLIQDDNKIKPEVKKIHSFVNAIFRKFEGVGLPGQQKADR